MPITCTKGKNGKNYYFRNGKRISEKTAKNSTTKIKYNYSKSRSRSRSRSRFASSSKKSTFNKFFNKIQVINLKEIPEKWQNVNKQFKKQGVKASRFIAVDGRCIIRKKNGTRYIMTPGECDEKRIKIQKKNDVYIPKHGKNKHGKARPLKEMLPAASLTIGTLNILREMVKKKWERVLICEDDILLEKNINKLLERGINEIKKNEPDWDMLYLGCGGPCGSNCISYKKGKKAQHKTEFSKFYPDDEWYVCNPVDLRSPCDYVKEDGKCDKVSTHLSRTISPGGTWCYAYSLKGAKKFLKNFPKTNKGQYKVSIHVDDYLRGNVEKGNFNAIAFDPPIAWHEEGAIRTSSDIPWEW